MNSVVRRQVALVVTVLMVTALLSLPAMAQEKIQLYFTSWLDNEFLHKYVDFANRYMQARYPNVEVIGQTTAGTDEDYMSKLLVSAAAGVAPDIYFFNLGDFDPELVTKYNIMLPLDSRMDADPEYKADFPAALLDAWRYKGVLYGVPTTIGQYAVYYNRQDYAEAGLAPPSADWTIRGEFTENIKKLHETDASGNVIRYGIKAQSSLGGRFMNYVLSEGGRIVDPELTHARINEHAFIDTVAHFKELVDTGYIQTPGGTREAYEAFINHDASMLMTGIFYQSRIQEHSNFDWGIPRIPAGQAGRKTVANTNAWVVNPKSKHVDLAWELAKAFSTAEFTEYALKEGLEFPVALSGLRKWFFETLPPNLTREEGAIWLEAMEYLSPFPKHPLMQDILDIASEGVGKVWRGEAAPGPTLQAAAEQINSLIEQNR